MKKTQMVSVGIAFVLAITFTSHAQTVATTVQSASADSIVSVVAEAQGLPLLSPDHVPFCGTFWIVLPGSVGAIAPFPCPPLDPSVPVYQIADGQFLVDETGGQVPVMTRRVGLQAHTVASVLVAEADAVANLIAQVQTTAANQQARMMARAMGMDVPSPGDGSGDGGDGSSPMFSSSYTIDTNGLWLEITNVSNGWSYLNLHNGTNQVYAVWGTTNLATPFTNWQVETELWPSNAAVLPFTVPTLDRPDLFLRAEDWTGVTENGNQTPDWWFWAYFGATALSDTNLDNVGNSLLSDYQFGFDPNVIQFSLRFTNAYVNASPVYGTIDLVGGVPDYKAVLINDTNQAHAVWQPYSSGVVANLNLGDGIYTVMVGLRGLAPHATPSWLKTTLTLNTAPLVITVTNPAASTVWQPVVQVQGFANKPLTSLNYDISNAAGVFTNQSGFITGQAYDTNLLASASYFQCYDLALTNGVNSVTLHATDIFGNTTTTNLNIALDYSSATHPPALTLVWPTNYTVVAGTNFTLQGLLDDATASVVVSVGASTFPGLVERDGRFSVANLPLSGTNLFIISSTNAAGLGVSESLTVVQGTVLVTIDSSPAPRQEFITVTGTISDDSHDVYVNGVKATVSGDPTWEANNVPVLDNQGSGPLTVNVYPPGSDPSVTPPTASQQALIAMQPTVQAVRYQEQFIAHDDEYLLWYGHNFYDTKLARQWANGVIGASVETTVENWGFGSLVRTINLSWPVYWPDGQVLNGTISWPSGSNLYSGYSPSTWANATLETSGAVPLDNPNVFGTSQRQMTRKAVTEVQLVASGPALPGAFQLIRLLVSAAGYTDNGLVYWAGFYDTYFYTGFEEPGDVPLPATAIQILGQAVAPTATNNYVGEKYVLLPAGAVHDLPVSATGTNSSNYSFDVQAVPGLTIVDGNSGQDLTLQTNTVIVGQQMNLICKTVTANGPTLNNFQWKVPGFAISNYVANGNSGIVYTNFPTDNSNVIFYWADGANDRIVQCSAVVSGKPVAATATFSVLRPTATLTPQLTTNQPSVSISVAGYPGDGISLHPGSYDSPAITWIGIVTTPANGAGAIAFTQLAAPERHVIYTNGVAEKWTSNGTNMLDGIYGVQYAGETPIGGGGTRSWVQSDTPQAGVDVLKYASVNDHFQTYLMYKPDGDNSIWVTLQTLNWSWGGMATKGTNGVWSLSNSTLTTTEGSDSTILPQWNGSAANIQWVPE